MYRNIRSGLHAGCAQVLRQHKYREQVVGFVEEIELCPLCDGEQAIFGMEAGTQEAGIIRVCEDRIDLCGLRGYQLHQVCEGFVQAGGELRIFFRHVSFEGRGRRRRHFFQAADEDGLIGGQVSDVLKGAPFVGVDALPECCFGEAPGDLPKGFMLVAQAGRYGSG